MDDLAILFPALAAAALMIFTHSYFGLHVLARGIIFVDLALAQVAALGASVAFLAGHDAHDIASHLYAFGATLLAALALSQIRRIHDKTAREVTIGMVYVVATALSVVILSRSTQGMEELKAIFNGNILWVTWQEIGGVAMAYALIAAFHFFFRQQFHRLSHHDESDHYSTLWEFLFFASFAVVITLAVDIGGILLVFACLIIPAFSATLLCKTFWPRLLLSWLLGILGASAGIWIAFSADLPVGAAIVSTLGALPLLAIAARKTMRR